MRYRWMAQWLLQHCAQLEKNLKISLSLSLFSFFASLLYAFFLRCLTTWDLHKIHGHTQKQPKEGHTLSHTLTHTHRHTQTVLSALIWMYYNKFRRYKIPAQKDTKRRCLHELFRASPAKWNQGRHTRGGIQVVWEREGRGGWWC